MLQKFLGKKSQENGPVAEKWQGKKSNKKGLGRKTRQETGNGNHMTALKFQTFLRESTLSADSLTVRDARTRLIKTRSPPRSRSASGENIDKITLISHRRPKASYPLIIITIKGHTTSSKSSYGLVRLWSNRHLKVAKIRLWQCDRCHLEPVSLCRS